MSKLHIKTGDTVVLLTGDKKDRKTDGGKMKTGKVLQVAPKEGKVIVEGANIVKKHVKPRNAQEQGGIVEAPAAMYSSKVQLYCDKCKKATRAAHKIDGDKKTRVCAKCGAAL